MKTPLLEEAVKHWYRISYLVFLQSLHHQYVILPEVSEQLGLGGGPVKQVLICNI